MTKLFTVLGAVLLVAFQVRSQTPDNTQMTSIKDQEGLHGPVQSVRIERAKLAHQQGKYVEGQRLPWRTLSFAEKGQQTEQEIYNDDGSLSVKSVFHYNDQGKLSTVLEYNSTGTAVGKKVYTRSPDGKRIEEVH